MGDVGIENETASDGGGGANGVSAGGVSGGSLRSRLEEFSSCSNIASEPCDSQVAHILRGVSKFRTGEFNRRS